MIQFIRFMCAFSALNYFSGKTNLKHLMHEAMDIGIVLKEVSQDGVISQEDKDDIVLEIQELSDAAIKFLDDIKLPE